MQVQARWGALTSGLTHPGQPGSEDEDRESATLGAGRGCTMQYQRHPAGLY